MCLLVFERAQRTFPALPETFLLSHLSLLVIRGIPDKLTSFGKCIVVTCLRL